MFRFIALICESDNSATIAAAKHLGAQLHASSRWQRAIDQERVRVFFAGGMPGADEARVLPNSSGVILGTLFIHATAGGSASPRVVLSESNCRQILGTRGQHLIQHYWGRYVAVMCDPATDEIRILRDPSGHMPCYLTRSCGVRIYFSHLEDCMRTGVAHFSINWDYLLTRVVLLGLQCRETALREVEEVQCGQCDLVTRDSSASTFYWNPCAIAREACIDDPVEAEQSLKATATACVGSWAAAHPSILHRLSGGLDSSIVLCCLRDSQSASRITCVTYYPEDEDVRCDSDECGYAREMARAAGCDLVEVPRIPCSQLDCALDPGYFPVPMIIRGRNVAENAIERRLAHERSATARFGGEGGDQIFFQAPVRASVGDRVWHRGVTVPAFRAAWDVAEAEQLSIWAVLRRALAEGCGRAAWNPTQELTRTAEFVSADAVRAVQASGTLLSRFSHPWFQAGFGVPHGKLWQIMWLSTCPRLHAPLDHEQDAQRVEPLTSQPLLDLCLRIPTYILASGGQSRGLARRAFSGQLPENVRARQLKGSIESFIRRTIVGNIRFVRDTLLDGVLVREKLLDRGKLETALCGRPERIAAAPGAIFDYLAVEAWTRRWKRDA